MEQIISLPMIVRPVISPVDVQHTDSNKRSSFIEANTTAVAMEEVRHQHIIPVFVKTNEPLISHAEFIDAAISIASEIFNGEQVLSPQIRVSHPVKGRIPDAKDKPAIELMEWEKTLYYERMAFVIEIPSIQTVIDGNALSLTIGGVKSYSTDNLYSRNIGDQQFKIFIGFKNTVCCNMCVWSDGYMDDVKVKSIGMLKGVIHTLLEGYNQNYHLHHLQKLTEYSITEQQFAQLIGRCRMYNHLPADVKKDIPPMLFGDTQMSTVVRDFYKDESFCRDANGDINLWKLYNLFTGANKSTYIDSFLDRSVNAFNFVEQVRYGLEGRADCWYLN